MSPTTVSKAETKYPIFAATFAHNDPAVLAVAGGGGAGRSGVPNAITLFDTSSRKPDLEPIAEVQLSREEDSVTCLANLATKDGMILYAGINSTEVDRLKGKNEHLRSFEVSYPKKNKAVKNEKPQGSIRFLSKTALLNPPSSDATKKEAYQRLIRLSPPKLGKSGSKRIGAIASSLAGDDNEIVIFSATSNKPSSGEIIQRIALPKGEEANDVDVFEVEEGHFQVAYSTDHSVFLQDINWDFGKRKPTQGPRSPAKKYEVPFPDVFEKKGRLKIRSLRFVTPRHLILLCNLPNRSGVELRLLRLSERMGNISLVKRLPSHVKAAVDLDVSILAAQSDEAYQIIAAVAGIDVSLSIYTIDFSGNSLSKFLSFATYRDVHPVQMTKIVFSPFFPPIASPGKSSQPQYVRLASTSLGNTISIETFELQRSGGRYILQSARMQSIYAVLKWLAIGFIGLAMAFMIQSLVDSEGNYTKGIIPESLRNAASGLQPPGIVLDEARRASASVEQATEGLKSPVVRKSRRIRDLIHPLRKETKHDNAGQKALVIHHDPDADSSLSTEVHADPEAVVRKHTEAKTWEQLTQAERKKWKNKLVDAGVWAVEEGETVLKGIFFSEAAGLVGHVAQGIING